MRLSELVLFYLLVGGGCGIAVVALKGASPPAFLDAAIIVPLWPLYGPFLLAQTAGVATDPAASNDVLRALAKVKGTPLAAFLPDETAGRALAQRIRGAGERIAEIDALLAQPEFSEADALARHDEFREKDAQVAGAALKRVQNIRRLRALRDRFSRELDQVSELLKQLRIQAEVVRLSGTSQDGVRELVQELLARVEGLDEVMELDEPRAG
jgi:hypothetical protein